MTEAEAGRQVKRLDILFMYRGSEKVVDSYPKNNHLNDSGLIGDFLKKREGKWGHVSCVLTGSDKDLGCSMLTLSVSVGLLLSQQELELMQCPNIEDKIVVVRKKKKKVVPVSVPTSLFVYWLVQ